MIKVLMGIDVGTTTTKAVIFNRQGRELARATSKPYHNLTPHPGWVEQDPEEIWAALLGVIHDVCQSVGKDVDITAVSMAVQSGSLIITDKVGQPIYPLVTWLDGRAEEIVTDWKAQGHQDWIKPLSGWSLYPSLCLPTIAWFKKNDPALFSSAGKFLSLNDFLVFRLCGRMVTNPSNAGGMQLVDISTGQWNQELLKLAGIGEENLSVIEPSGHEIGPILPAICHQTGLQERTILVNGGHDQACTALGLGIINPGKWLLACGTAWVFTGVLDSPEMANLPPTLDLNFHAAPNRWALSQSLGGLGASFEWWLNKAYASNPSQVNSTRTSMFTTLDKEIIHTHSDDQLFFLPMTGGHADPATTRRGGLLGLQLGHNRADLARAVMESAAFELRWALASVTASNLPVERLWMVGGAAQSPLWPAILADVTGIPISLPQYDTWPALGAAILAGFGTGEYSSLEQGLTVFQKDQTSIDPQPEMFETYQHSYSKYKQLCSTFQ